MNGAGLGTDYAPPELLAFLAPGIVHALGNSLFAVSGNAQFLSDQRQPTSRLRGVILGAVENAEHAVDLLRCLSEPSGDDRRPEQAGVLLNRLAPILRVPLRDRDLGLEIGHSSTETPRSVAVRPFVLAVAEATRLAHELLPRFVDGALHLDLCRQSRGSLDVVFEVRTRSQLLPFPLQFDAVAERMSAWTARERVSVASEAGARLTLTLPTVG